MKFKTTILQSGNNTGIEVPEKIIAQLGAGKKPSVVITLNGYTYRNTVAVMGGKYLVSLSKVNRTNAGVKGGDTLEINLDLDTAPRLVELPPDFEKIIGKNKPAGIAYGKLSPSRKKAMVLSITDAKTKETRAKRIEKALAELLDKKN
ncbi:MAG: YdeI/OmpD-associated family protein [Bacteroidota bacterium]